MGKVHNKKRNVGIIYEQIISFICQQTLEGNLQEAKKATRIIKERFNSKTQLNKEYKLFKALIQTKDISESLSTSIISEAKKACNYHFDEKSLEFEKSKLIKELNYNFGKGKIFKNKVKDYRMYATVQTLLNEWRKNKNLDISIIAEYEKYLHEWMISKNDKNNTEIIEENNKYKNIDSFTFKLMNEKFNKKYNNTLDNQQKIIVSMYITNESNLPLELKKLKNESLSELYNYRKECNSNVILESYDGVIKKVKNLDSDNINEENLKKFLSLTCLIKELKGSD